MRLLVGSAVVLSLCCFADVARADLMEGTIGGNLPALRASRAIYSHTRSIKRTSKARKNWASRQINDLRVRSEPTRSKGYRSPYAQEAPVLQTMDNTATADQAVDAMPREKSEPTDRMPGDGDSGLGGGGALSVEGGGLGDGLVPQQLEGMEAAFAAAGALASLTDGTLALALSLQGMFGGGLNIDWATIFESSSDLQSARARREEERRKLQERRKKAREAQIDAENVNIKRVVRSGFKIFAGLALGMLMLMFLRRGDREI